MNIEDIARDIHEISCRNGWFDRNGRRKDPDIPFLFTVQERKESALALLHAISELTEAADELTSPDGAPRSIREVGGKPVGLPVELADALLIILSQCQAYDIPIMEALKIKMNYEATRGERSGGKLF